MMSFIKFVFAVSTFVLFAPSVLCGPCKLTFHDCGSQMGKLNTAMYNGTCSSGKAILKRGTVVTIDFNFQANAQESALTSYVYGKIGELPFVKFSLGNPDACKDSGLKCPIPANTAEDYVPVLDVLKIYPKVNVIVKWELKDSNGKDVFCALIPASITD